MVFRCGIMMRSMDPGSYNLTTIPCFQIDYKWLQIGMETNGIGTNYFGTNFPKQDKEKNPI